MLHIVRFLNSQAYSLMFLHAQLLLSLALFSIWFSDLVFIIYANQNCITCLKGY